MIAERPIIPFRSVNRCGAPGYRPGLQRHHLVPRQILTMRSFARLVDAMGTERRRFDDFRRNGMLLPANDDAALCLGLPLHRGPHRIYSELVLERFGQIEAGWAAMTLRTHDQALVEALARLELLQQALRKRLLSERAPLLLNRAHQSRVPGDFAVLDAMAARLWSATAATECGGDGSGVQLHG